MNAIGLLALMFIAVPILELILLIQIGQVLGVLPTVALVLLTGVAGAALARMEGLRVLRQFQQELAAGRMPGQAMLDGASVLLGGALLLTPGVLTDVMGLALLFPPTRRLIQRFVRSQLERGVATGSIRVMTVGPDGLESWGRGEPRETTTPPGLDASKGIVIEPRDGAHTP